jgi:hypothetical protein
VSSTDVYEDEVFDADDIADGFGDEEIELDDVEEIPVEELGDADAVEVVEDDVEDAGDTEDIEDGDNEADLAEVLEARIWKVATTKGAVVDDGGVMGVEALPAPKQKDEFRCSSCRLLKKNTQLADPAKVLCKDCV